MKYKNKKDKSFVEIYLAAVVGFLSFYKYKNLNYSITIFIIVILFSLILRFIISYYKKRTKYEKFISSSINIVDKMKGEEFEEFLLAHFNNLGYKGHITAKTKDYGADLILTKNNEKIVVQAKRWIKKVGIEAVQQIVGARAYYKASKCIVISNNYFTQNAVNLAKSSNVQLWDRKKLLDIISKANGKEILESHFTIEKIEQRHICKKCGADMILKNGKYGHFYGCSNYPKCKYTESSN